MTNCSGGYHFVLLLKKNLDMMTILFRRLFAGPLLGKKGQDVQILIVHCLVLSISATLSQIQLIELVYLFFLLFAQLIVHHFGNVTNVRHD
jgi:hypothetical protein